MNQSILKKQNKKKQKGNNHISGLSNRYDTKYKIIMMHFKILSAFLALVAASTCDAFAPSMTSNRLPSVNGISTSPRVVGFPLQMSDNDAAAEGETAATDEGEPEPAPEDPEVTAIKNEIADLEKQLKEKKSQVDYLQDAADLNSKAGYARKVAEMENMRRARSVSL